MDGHDGIVLTGGTGRRLGGISKAELSLAGRSLLAMSLKALSGARRVVVVGGEVALPEGPLPEVLWTREEPPGGGPAAAIAAALPLIDQPVVVVLAVDYPFAAGAVPRLLAALSNERGSAAGAVLVDAEGRPQTLLAAYSRHGLAAAVERHGPELGDRSVRELLEGLRLVQVPAEDNETLDIDTPEDLARAEEILGAS